MKGMRTVKKLLSILLALALILGLCACGGETPVDSKKETATGGDTQSAETETGLRAGFAKINITPDYPVGMGGYSDASRRMHTGLVDYVYTTCIAVSSDADTVLMFTVDIGGLGLDDQIPLREAVSETTGVPEDRIFIGSTHTHSAPTTTGYEAADRYTEDLTKWMAEAAQKALEDRSPATLSQTAAVHEGMNFVRHYIMEDGSLVANSDVEDRTKIVGHPMETDEQMVMLQFAREEPKKDILMVNWQSHPANSSEIGYYNIASDFVGPFRDRLEQNTGALVAYFTGAVGNQVPDSKWKQEANGLEWREYGEALADCASSMIPNLTPVEGIGIKNSRQTIQAEVDHSWDHMVAEATEVWELFQTSDRATADAAGEKYDFSSCYQAKVIIRRAKMGPTIDMEVNTFCIGDVGFTTGTYEMFSDNGIYVKENSPFAVTFLISGTSSYMPSDITYTYRGYEQDTTNYARGTGELFAEKYVEMLNALKTG